MTRARNACVLAAIAVVVTIVATMDTGRAASGYSTYSVRGTYRIAYTGVNLPSLVPESGIGIFVADGTGGIAGTETLNISGLICTNVALTGTYSVDPNGMGTMSATFTSPVPGCSGDFTIHLIVHDGGNLVRAVGGGPGFVTLFEEWRRD